MDLATIVGFFACFGIVAAGILMGGPMSMFVNGASIFIVIGGSLSVVLMRSSIGDFVGAISLAGQAFSNKVDKPEDLIEKVVELVLQLDSFAFGVRSFPMKRHIALRQTTIYQAVKFHKLGV